LIMPTIEKALEREQLQPIIFNEVELERAP
jgi:hypothetical protein